MPSRHSNERVVSRSFIDDYPLQLGSSALGDGQYSLETASFASRGKTGDAHFRKDFFSCLPSMNNRAICGGLANADTSIV
jgi:hypothetical protein